MSGTALLCLLVLGNTFPQGAFGPLLPEIARSEGLADWQLGVVAGAFGFARMAGAVPAGLLAARRLGLALAGSPACVLVGLLVLAAAGSMPMLVLGRLLVGLGHTLGMVGGLTAILLEDRRGNVSLRLNTYEFSGMLGVLGGLLLVGLAPPGWGWRRALLLGSAPMALGLAAGPALRRRFPDRGPHAEGLARAPVAAPATSASARALVRLMFVVGPILALSWSSVSQFLIPLRGGREFGLDRGGVSRVLAVAQVVDLLVLLPVGRAADRLGRAPVLGAVMLVLGAGTLGVGLGAYPLFVLGSACFGLGLAGWMLPLGVIRERTGPEGLAWRTGLYRVGVDAAVFLGPLVSGFLGEARAGLFVAAVGVAALLAGARLLHNRANSSLTPFSKNRV